MSSDSEKARSDPGVETPSDRFRHALVTDLDDDGNKPDFRELDLGSPVSPLRTRTALTTTTSSSSSSSGSVSARPNPGAMANIPKKAESSPNSHSGELSVDSSPSALRNFRPGHTRSHSSGSQQLIYSGSGSVSSPPPSNVHPTGNICPSGRVLRPGMATRPSKSDVLGSGSVNYGHGSIMRGGSASKPAVSSTVYPRGGLMVGGKGMGGTDAEELKRMGNDSYKKGNFTEALGLYEKAISISPGNAAYHFNKAAALMGLRRIVEAAKECEEAIRLDPGYMRAHHRLGSLLLSLGQVEVARKHICFPGHQPDPIEVQKLQSVEKHLSKCTDARRTGDWIGVLREVESAIACGADSSPQLNACRAEALLKLNQLDDAHFSWSNISKSEPYLNSCSQSKIFGMLFEVYLLFVRTEIELAMGKFDSAVVAIEKAAQLNPQNFEISTLLNKTKLVVRARARGNDLFKSERYTEACAAYGEGLKLDPSNSVLYCNRAACWFKLSQWKKSVDDCTQALRIQPNYTKALLRRAASNHNLQCWSESVKDYEILKKELPDDKEVADNYFKDLIALKKSRGESVKHLEVGGKVESLSGFEQFQAAISSPSASVVHFKASSNLQCENISSFLDSLCTRYPSVNFFKVDIEDDFAIAKLESVSTVPTFKIYRRGTRVTEMICPSPEMLEMSVKHYSV